MLEKVVVPPSFIMDGCNEQKIIRVRNKSGDWSIRKVKLKISSQSSSKFMISKPQPGTPASNKMDSNYETCCLGTNFIVMDMIEMTADV